MPERQNLGFAKSSLMLVKLTACEVVIDSDEHQYFHELLFSHLVYGVRIDNQPETIKVPQRTLHL